MSERNQQQSASIVTETPLHYFFGKTGATSTGQISDTEKAVVTKVVTKVAAKVVIKEATLKGYLNLRGNPAEVLFVNGVEEVLGVKLPVQPGRYETSAETNSETRVFWLGPDEWLVMVKGGTEAQVESQLRQRLQGHFSIVDISGGQTLINLSGDGVATVLKKSSVYDFHPRHFGVGRCVQTTFAKATALVSKREDSSFDMVIRRSFADYLAQWLLDAGQEFGCRIEQDCQ